MSDGKEASPHRETTSNGFQVEQMNRGTVWGEGRWLSGQPGVLVPGQEHRALHHLKWTSIKGRILHSLLLKPSPSKIIICISLVFFISEGFMEARLFSFIITLEVSFFTC